MRHVILFIAFYSIISCKPQLSPNKDLSIPTEINTIELKEILNQDHNMVLLDVRTADEISNGKILGAIEIDYFSDDFTAQIDQLDTSKHYLVYCKSGGRSAKSIAIMKDKGFTKCTNLKGGYTAWSSK